MRFPFPFVGKHFAYILLVLTVAHYASAGETRLFNLPYGMQVRIPATWQLLDNDLNEIKDPPANPEKSPRLDTPKSASFAFQTGAAADAPMAAIVMKSFDGFLLNEKSLAAIAAGKVGEQPARLKQIMPRHSEGEDTLTRLGAPTLMQVDGHHAMKSRYVKKSSSRSLAVDEIFLPIGTRTISMELVTDQGNQALLAADFTNLLRSWKVGASSPGQERKAPQMKTPGTFIADGSTYQLPPPAGMRRLDGLSNVWDAVFEKTFANDNLILIAVFGTAEDAARLGVGEDPKLSHTLALLRTRQYPTKLTANLSIKEIFEGMKLLSKDELFKSANPAFEDRLIQLGESKPDASGLRRQAETEMGAKAKIDLGIHHEDLTSYGISAIEKDELLDSKTQVLTASDFSMVLVRKHILLVKIRSIYNSHADLELARKTATEFSRQLREANP